MIEVRSAAEAEKADRRQKRIIGGLFLLGFLGVAYAVYDYTQIMDRAAMPQELTAVDPVIQRWKAAGLVHDFDPKTALLVVDEGQWGDKGRPEKIGIITQLARYCASQRNVSTWELTVKGRQSSATLGEFGPNGIKVF